MQTKLRSCMSTVPGAEWMHLKFSFPRTLGDQTCTRFPITRAHPPAPRRWAAGGPTTSAPATSPQGLTHRTRGSEGGNAARGLCSRGSGKHQCMSSDAKSLLRVTREVCSQPRLGQRPWEQALGCGGVGGTTWCFQHCLGPRVAPNSLQP